MKLFLVLAFLLPYCDVPAQKAPKRLVLVSYCNEGNAFRFNLMPERDFTWTTSIHPQAKADFPDYGYIGNVRVLKQSLAWLPRGTFIEWRQWKPSGTCFPPDAVVEDIEAYAASRGVELRIIRTKSDTRT